ncbi:putative tyrosine-protein phosphatase OCA1 [Yarrowia sp. C11]|nr:putative tyrosine-protein phosphatase OCA1 [Yarrowia sp. C11]KAG5370557.1 putative tyrosine-protein phosphatase OCA1 [Yarrowia sp. E02]
MPSTPFSSPIQQNAVLAAPQFDGNIPLAVPGLVRNPSHLHRTSIVEELERHQQDLKEDQDSASGQQSGQQSGDPLDNTNTESNQEEVASGEETPPSPRMKTIVKPPPIKVVPPLNFGPVERNLYRSGQPEPISFPFLEKLRLRTILWLAVEDPSDNFLAFADDHEIIVHHLGLVTEGTNPWDQLTESSIVAALQIIMDRDSYPLLVCCGMGRHRTGTIVGCLRRLQGWNLASVSEEYRRYAGSRGGRALIELHIEAFDTSRIIVYPESAPEWCSS